MINKRIALKDTYQELGESNATLEAYCYEKDFQYGFDYRRPAILIIPGGGYEFIAYREKDPVAFRFLNEGFNCFALTYSCHKPYPLPQLEVTCAIDYLKKNKDELGLNDDIVVLGFSAGGHLAASYGLKYLELGKKINSKHSLKPTAIFCAYPVINLLEDTHRGTSDVISGGDNALKEELSIDLQLTSSYPPTYLWATYDDQCVPCNNLTRMVEALRKNNVPYRFDLFDNRDHGMAVATRGSNVNRKPLDEDEKKISKWVENAIEFFDEITGGHYGTN